MNETAHELPFDDRLLLDVWLEWYTAELAKGWQDDINIPRLDLSLEAT